MKTLNALITIVFALMAMPLYASDPVTPEDVPTEDAAVTTTSESQLRDRIQNRRDSTEYTEAIAMAVKPKKKNNNIKLVYQIADLDTLVMMLDQNITIQSQKNEALQQQLDIFMALTTPSDTIFVTELPHKSVVPLALMGHYQLILSLQQNLKRMADLQSQIRDAESSVIMAINKKLLSKSLSEIAEFVNSLTPAEKGSLSHEQKEYINRNLVTPLNNYIQLYLE